MNFALDNQPFQSKSCSIILEAFAHLNALLLCLCDGDTLGSQGSDVLLSRGRKVGVAFATSLPKINVS